ncbi:hypothetical protein BHE74_00025087 [Ensete ventricosum]|nr:hypothetical protein BHE74_00025087 [Ensete ventricosum]
MNTLSERNIGLSNGLHYSYNRKREQGAVVVDRGREGSDGGVKQGIRGQRALMAQLGTMSPRFADGSILGTTVVAMVKEG